MRTASFVLLVLCVASLLIAAPTAAEEPDGQADEECWKVYTDPPGVVVDPECIKEKLPPPEWA